MERLKTDDRGLIIVTIKIFMPGITGYQNPAHTVYYPFHLCLYMLYHDIYVVINHNQSPPQTVSAGRPDTHYHIITEPSLTSITITVYNICSNETIKFNLYSYMPIIIKLAHVEHIMTLRQSQLSDSATVCATIPTDTDLTK